MIDDGVWMTMIMDVIYAMMTTEPMMKPLKMRCIDNDDDNDGDGFNGGAVVDDK